MMRVIQTLGALALFVLLSVSGLCQTDPQGRQHALQMYEAYSAGTQGGNYGQFEQLFMRDPLMTRRAFVSTMEYATEVYQSDMNSAGQAVTFAGHLADLIGRQFGDQAPSAMLKRLLGQDPSAMNEFYQYAVALYPGYANGAAPGAQPGYQPGMASPGGGYQQYPPNNGMPGGGYQQYPPNNGMPGGGYQQYPPNNGTPGGGGYQQYPPNNGMPGGGYQQYPPNTGMPGGGYQQYPPSTGMPGGGYQQYPQNTGMPGNSGPFRPANATGGPGGNNP